MIIPPPALARASVDRAANVRNDPAMVAGLWADPRTKVIRVLAGETLVAGDPPRLVRVAPCSTSGERYLLGVDGDGTAYFAAVEPLTPVAGQTVAGLRAVGALLDDRDTGLLVQAIALANWHATHTHCARCGEPTEIAAAGYLRRCPVDGSEHFPRTDPAVIMLVTDADDRALLGRQHAWPAGRFSTLAGFVEPGESAEQAVVREVREEAGVQVADVRYVASQPWPFPSSLMLGFDATATTTEIILDDELAEAVWLDRGELAWRVREHQLTLPPPVSIARRLIARWYGRVLERPSRPHRPDVSLGVRRRG